MNHPPKNYDGLLMRDEYQTEELLDNIRERINFYNDQGHGDEYLGAAIALLHLVVDIQGENGIIAKPGQRVETK